MNDTNFRIIETERKILDILNNCELPIVVISMIINGIKDNIDLKKMSVLKAYNERVIEDGNSTKNSD